MKSYLIWIVIAGIVVLAPSFYLIKSQTETFPSPRSAETFSFPPEKIFSDPVRLRVPAIGIDAKVEYAGIAADGSMEVPKGPDNVAWYKLGPKPGESGSAVMAGHFGPWKSGARSVFDNLNKLKKGDTVYVVDKAGTTTAFTVREIRNYDPKADATYVFSSNDGMAHLNLITCEGVWNSSKKTYSNRLVVFTDKKVE